MHRMITMHTHPRQTDRWMNIMAIAWQFVLMNALHSKNWIQWQSSFANDEKTAGKHYKNTNLQHSINPLTANPVNAYTLPYWSNPPFLIFDIRTLWRSGLSAIASECQKLTGSSTMAERPRELDQRFQTGGQFEAIIDWRVTFHAIATWCNLYLRIIW